MEKLTGSIERITYYNDENGYSVLKILPDQRRMDADRDGTVTVVGMLPELQIGESVEFTGDWVMNPQYGRQFKADAVISVPPTSPQGLINYLGGGLVKGIGPVTAEKIVKKFGKDTLKVLDYEPERLYDVIKPNLAKKLIETWGQMQAGRDAMIFLQQYGVSTRLATRIVKELGAETVTKVRTDPYVLADEVYGVGFIKADAIAQKMGLQPDSPSRLRAGMQYALSQAANEGHCFLPRETLLAKTAELLKVENPARIELVLGQQLRDRDLVSESAVTSDGEPVEAIYLPMFHFCEQSVAWRLRRLQDSLSMIKDKVRTLNWETFLAGLAKRSRVKLTDQQREAVRAALTSKVSVLTGGPGTGKTTTLRMVIEALSELGISFALASPTGRAAKRLSESTGRPASTIHRLLGYTPVDGFGVNQENPLKEDMIIIDEMSMVDLILFHHLLKAIRPQAHLMLVGDVNQLPSVGAGNVLRDVIDSGLATVTWLDTIFRQDKDSHIIVNAHRVNRGDDPYMDNNSNDFFFFGEDDAAKAADLVVDIVQNRLPAKFGVDPMRDVQVIAPMYRGPAGVDALNERLQQALNNKRYTAEKTFGGRLFRAGDKVMQTRNNYDKDVFNGDIGRLQGFDFDNQSLKVMMEDGRIVDYDWGEIDQLRHAYCISTHRSQGSEYPVVVIPILTQHYMMLQRNLLYTAITRAKKLVVLVGSRRAVSMAVRNNRVATRYTALMMRLRDPHAVEAPDEAFEFYDGL